MQALLVLDKSHAYGRNPGLASLTWQCNGAVAALKILRNQGDRQRTNASLQANILDGPANCTLEIDALTMHQQQEIECASP